MFLNVFAAEMAQGITKENVKECINRIGSDGVEYDDGFYRSYILYLALLTNCRDYLQECDYKPGDAQYESIANKLADIAQAFHGSPTPLPHGAMSKMLDRGLFLVLPSLLSDSKGNPRPLKKATLDKILDLFRILVILAGVKGDDRAIKLCDYIIDTLTVPSAKSSKLNIEL